MDSKKIKKKKLVLDIKNNTITITDSPEKPEIRSSYVKNKYWV
jgi:hypothetical protein